VALHKLAHVELDQRLLAAEQKFGQRLGQQRLADAGGPQEHKAADGRLGSFRPARARRTALADGLDGLFLADDALVHHALHLQQTLALLAGDALTGTPVHMATTSAISSGRHFGLIGRLVPAFAQFASLGSNSTSR
jgi:hypothetical protein